MVRFHHNESQNVQLHVFCDAFEVAYGAVAYFRTVTNGRVSVGYIISKTRLAPIKTLTILRLELQAAESKDSESKDSRRDRF